MDKSISSCLQDMQQEDLSNLGGFGQLLDQSGRSSPRQSCTLLPIEAAPNQRPIMMFVNVN